MEQNPVGDAGNSLDGEEFLRKRKVYHHCYQSRPLTIVFRSSLHIYMIRCYIIIPSTPTTPSGLLPSGISD